MSLGGKVKSSNFQKRTRGTKFHLLFYGGHSRHHQDRRSAGDLSRKTEMSFEWFQPFLIPIHNGSAGGAGVNYDISGTALWYAGGGGGGLGRGSGGSAALGGSGVGGAGSLNSSTPGAGLAGRGAGGGGAAEQGVAAMCTGVDTGGAGGKGVVIIRHPQ